MAVEEALAAIIAAQDILMPQHEGLRDFARLNLLPATLIEVRASLEQFDRRARILSTARLALETLIADGFPVITPRPIEAAALADLQNNADSIEAALKQFALPDPAAGLNLAASDPEPKA